VPVFRIRGIDCANYSRSIWTIEIGICGLFFRMRRERRCYVVLRLAVPGELVISFFRSLNVGYHVDKMLRPRSSPWTESRLRNIFRSLLNPSENLLLNPEINCLADHPISWLETRVLYRMRPRVSGQVGW
jgi:hypothetical protein